MNAQESIEEIVPTFFLDAVPNELLDNVLRFLSRVPAVKKWEAHLLLYDLIPLFKVDGQLGTMMKSRFTALCVAPSGEVIYEKIDYHWDPPTKDKGFAVDDFANNCPNVTSLSVLKADPEWVFRYGKQLKKLEITIDNTSCISKHCTSLQELNIFPFGHLGDNHPVVDLWEKVGDTLEKLTMVKWTGVPVHHLENIEKYCRKLRHIDVQVDGECGFERAQVLKLICSYGEQLESAQLYNMRESELLDLVNACKNCLFHLPIHQLELPVLSSLQILGNQLGTMNIYYGEATRDYDAFKKAWDGCVNLRRLTVNAFQVDISKEILDTCAEGCGNVRRLEYKGPEIPLDAFDKFIERNKPSFSSAYLNVGFDDLEFEQHLKVIAPFVRASIFIEISAGDYLFDSLPEKSVRKLGDCGALVRVLYGRVPLYQGHIQE